MPPDHRSRLTPARRRLLDRLLDELLDLDPAAREARLQALKARCPRVHGWLERLLEASQSPVSHLHDVVARSAEQAVSSDNPPALLQPGDRLGSWQIVGPAGRGGMGIVYRAERADGAFEMDAAIKLVGSRHPGLVERLVQERQLLARLNHPGISRLIDGGVTESGQAYLVMEWVAGEDLSESLRSGLDPLATFAEIADALTHAHQRMVVHGDIKPGNVRITPRGRARLLDFGVARLLADDVLENEGPLRGLTPAFAAPELLAGQTATAQSDLWAAGALLNWLLTGQRPTGDGRPPDTSNIVHKRAGELAAVIGKACAEDPAQRYPSVAALAEEIGRIRSQHPVQVRPAGPLRRLRLWSRRNPVGALLAVVLTVGAVVGAAVFGWQAQLVRAERDLARVENTRWEIMREQLVTLFRVVADEAGDEDLGARELLDGSVDRLDGLLADDDQGRAYIETMLGSLYVALQDYQSAADVLRPFVDSDAAGAAPILRSDAYGNLALAEVHLGNHERALALVDEAIEMVSDQPGDYRRRLSELHATRGSALRGLGDWSAAIETLERSVALALEVSSKPHRTLAMASNNLGVNLNHAGRIAEARRAFENALEHWRALGLGESSDALTVLGNLAAIYYRQGDLALAESAYAEAIELRRRRFGASAALAAAMNNYGQVLLVRHRLDEAREQLVQARDMMGRFNGQESPHFALMLRSLGMLALTAGEVDRARATLAQAETILVDSVGPDHLFTVLVRAQQAMTLARRDPGAGVERFDEVIAQMAELGEPAETHRAGALCEQAVVLIDLERIEAARTAAEDCLEIRRAHLQEGNWEILKARALVAAADEHAGDAEARALLNEHVEALAQTYGPGHPRLIWLEDQLQP
ncbi:serine/threonine-protein kinase [Wenzhouxiangella limi]|uniref:Serine/threonine protein kinase n=1 Tax=Wenzhouxiangella limi TaxID=2707351 RepID=A0A845VAA3_9GAMM|nr:serine/threonine-protein kinase [Wenzhouxiangella limi]NDY94249.1 serine/threonine protein kinase [Wenzhouxiangella limi]